MNLSGSINFTLMPVRKVRMALRRGLQNKGIGISHLFTSIVRFKPDIFLCLFFFSEYRPSAYGGVVVVLDQRRLQMRRRVRS